MKLVTTLTTRELSSTEVEYSLSDNNLVIKISSTDHEVYGLVDIELSNVKEISVYQDGQLKDDFFNDTFQFQATSRDALECHLKIDSGIPESPQFIELPNDGSEISCFIDNASLTLAAGTYNFSLLDSSDSDFSTSLISVRLVDIASTGVDGIEAIFDEEGLEDYLSINNQDLTFNFNAEVSIKDNDEGTTNIPLVISLA